MPPKQKVTIIDAEFREISRTENPLPAFQSQSFQENQQAEEYLPEVQQEVPAVDAPARESDCCVVCKRTSEQVKLKTKVIGPVHVLHCKDCGKLTKTLFNLFK